MAISELITVSIITGQSSFEGFSSIRQWFVRLYELEPGRRLGWNIEKLSEDLASVLGRRVDLVSRAALHQRLRDDVLAEALLLYAA